MVSIYEYQLATLVHRRLTNKEFRLVNLRWSRSKCYVGRLKGLLTRDVCNPKEGLDVIIRYHIHLSRPQCQGEMYRMQSDFCRHRTVHILR